MSVVVERGLARCPRCVAMADYTFVESGPNSVQYEVHCARCGASYREVHTPVIPDFAAAVGAWTDPPRRPQRGIRQRLSSRIMMACNTFRPCNTFRH